MKTILGVVGLAVSVAGCGAKNVQEAKTTTEYMTVATVERTVDQATRNIKQGGNRCGWDRVNGDVVDGVGEVQFYGVGRQGIFLAVEITSEPEGTKVASYPFNSAWSVVGAAVPGWVVDPDNAPCKVKYPMPPPEKL